MGDVERTALWLSGKGQAEIRRERVAVQADQLVLKTLYSGISRGTERLVFSGAVPASEWTRMACPAQEGSFAFPVKYGYANVARVEAGPDHLVDRTVFSLLPHQSRSIVAPSAIMLVPETVPARRAVLAANMETALNVVWDGRVQPGDRVAVIGAGVVGTLVAYLAQGIPGCDVTLIDIDSTRTNLATTLGIAFRGAQGTHRDDHDVVIHCSGNGDGLVQALDLAGFEGRIIEASWYGERTAVLPLGGAFHSRRLEIISSQVGQIPASHRSRWTYARRLEKAISLLADSRLDCLISGETPFRNAALDYARIINAPDTLAHVFSYE